MSVQFLLHLIIVSSIFYILSAGQKLFLKIKGTIDFSYLAIILVSSYTSVLLHLLWGRDIIASLGGALIASLIILLLIVGLSARLSSIYFSIGTLALYMLTYQLALSWGDLTGGAQGLSGFQRQVGEISLYPLKTYVAVVGSSAVLIAFFLNWFKKTYVYTLLHGRGEAAFVTKSLGAHAEGRKIRLLVITSCLATLGGGFFAFYYLYIDPMSYWISFLILILTLTFLSYRANEFRSFLICLLVMGGYEYLRFFKLVDVAYIGYMREMIFAILIMVASFWVFRTTTFGREA